MLKISGDHCLFKGQKHWFNTLISQWRTRAQRGQWAAQGQGPRHTLCPVLPSVELRWAPLGAAPTTECSGVPGTPTEVEKECAGCGPPLSEATQRARWEMQTAPCTRENTKHTHAGRRCPRGQAPRVHSGHAQPRCLLSLPAALLWPATCAQVSSL